MDRNGAYSEDGKRIVDELFVINTFAQGKDALAEYAERHTKDQTVMRMFRSEHTSLETVKTHVSGVFRKL